MLWNICNTLIICELYDMFHVEQYRFSEKYKNIIITSCTGQSHYSRSRSGRKWGFVDCNTTSGIFSRYSYRHVQKILTTKNVQIVHLKTRFFLYDILHCHTFFINEIIIVNTFPTEKLPSP
jgi:hypothetical protein